MALITSVTLPVAYVMMRNLLAAHYSWDEVGIWQGVSSISDAYLQFITASFSVYLLPTLSRLTSGRILPARFFAPCVLYCRRLRSPALPSGYCVISPSGCCFRRSLPPCAICLRQLVGDVLKVGAYVFGYLVIAKASLRLYIRRDRPVCAADGIFSLADPHPRCAGGGSGLYGNLYRLFRCLLRRIFTLA